MSTKMDCRGLNKLLGVDGPDEIEFVDFTGEYLPLGWQDVNNDKELILDRNRAIAKKRDYDDPEYLRKLSKTTSEGKLLSGNNPNNYPSFAGKRHSAETKKKMSEAMKRHRAKNYASVV